MTQEQLQTISEDIKEMGDSDLLDMDYFLHEECEVDNSDDEFDLVFT